MGMFDTIYVESKLLHDHNMLCHNCGLESIEFQTKDLDSTLECYYLHYANGIGRLHFMKDGGSGVMFDPGVTSSFTAIEVNPEWPHKWVNLYGNCQCNYWNEYGAKFTDGILQQIKRVDLVRVDSNGIQIQV
jgi:hypothetical protein